MNELNSLHVQQGSKGSQFVATARVEFGTAVLGESPKIENNSETGFINFDFTCCLNVTASDPVMLDELAQTPIVGKIVLIFCKFSQEKQLQKSTK